MDFYNPHIRQKNNKTFSKHTLSDKLTRIIPNCFKNISSLGITTTESTIPPVCFLNNEEHNIFSPSGHSIWKCVNGPPPCGIVEDNKLMFHLYDIVETIYTADRCDDVPYKFQTDIIPSGTVLKLLGKTKCGYSVCVNVFRQKIYFYARVPPCVSLNYIIQQAIKSSFGKVSCQFFTERTFKKILREYDTTEHEVYKITLSSSSMLSCIVEKLRDHNCDIFESNVDATKRFIIDNNFSTFGWYTCANAIIRQTNRDSNTDFEFDCGYEDLSFIKDRHEWPPYTILSFDIECIGEKGFPIATHDQDLVIQISCILWTVGENTCRNILLSLGTCDPIPDTEIYEFPSELDMFYAFFSMIRDINIEFITGYNIANFDIPYLIDRATHIYNFNLSEYTKVKSGSIFEVHKPFNSSQGFMRSVTKVKISGIVALDMYIVCKDKLSLSNYKLNTVAQQCVGAQKEDVSYKDIPILFRSGPEGRAKLGLYCVKDSILVMDLLKFFVTHIEISEIAKIAMIPVRRVLTDGQQIRVFTCLLAASKKENYILPVSSLTNTDGYQGATVINPHPGFYNTPVLVVDFASLYPSIIQAHNLCYSTLIPNESLYKHRHLKSSDYETFHISSGPVHFVKKHKSVSLLSKLLTTWLAKRKYIKNELIKCHDPLMKTILDKQQLAIKVTCNAVYGFTGVTSGLLPCVKIAETVTLQGRIMLEKSKLFIENITPQQLHELEPKNFHNEREAHLKVIYGDTDSLFIDCRGYPLSSVQVFCESLAAATTRALFEEPIKLEAEKIFQCLLLLAKKRYIGILSTDKLLMKGVDLIRKTTCKFIQDKCKQTLDLLLRDEEVKNAAQLLTSKPSEYVYQYGLPNGFLKIMNILNNSMEDLRSNIVPVKDLTFSTELSRPIHTYKTLTLPHLCVYNKILSRNEELPQIHDRIPYVFIKCDASKKSDMAEDPSYVEQNNIPIAVDLYLDKLIHGVANILQCVFENNRDKTVAILYNFITIPHIFE